MEKVKIDEFLKYLLKPSNGEVLVTMLKIFDNHKNGICTMQSDTYSNLFLSHGYIANLCGYHKDTVKRCLVTLESNELITCIIRKTQIELLNRYNINNDIVVYRKLLKSKIKRSELLKYRYERDEAKNILLPYVEELNKHTSVFDLYKSNV